MPPLLVALIGLALLFGLINGMLDSGNIVATMVSSRAFRPRVALLVTAAAEFAGPFLLGVAVAHTIGSDIVAPGSISLLVLVSAVATANAWSLVSWILAIPSSSSHALVGGLVGAVLVSAGWQVIMLGGLLKVLLALFISPLLGLSVGFLLTRLIFYLAQRATPRVNSFFKSAQIVTALVLAVSHGANGAPRAMGLITLGMVMTGYLAQFVVPLWVIAACSGLMALGTLLGSWKLIKTLGGRFYKIRPVHGFATQLTSAIIVLAASLVGGPVSSTQVVSAAIMGVGSAERLSKVRWGVGGDMLTAWLLTIPVTALLAAGVYWALTNIRF
jgi:PiT family inorganic phosphate transporter